jgi:hypothetical protein
VAIAIQLAFAKKFGRFPGDEDPVFFDPKANTPQPLNPDRVLRGMPEAMAKARTPPQPIYACYTTAFIVSGAINANVTWESAGVLDPSQVTRAGFVQ